MRDAVNDYAAKSVTEDQAESARRFLSNSPDAIVQIVEHPELAGRQRILPMMREYKRSVHDGPGLDWFVDVALQRTTTTPSAMLMRLMADLKGGITEDPERTRMALQDLGRLDPVNLLAPVAIHRLLTERIRPDVQQEWFTVGGPEDENGVNWYPTVNHSLLQHRGIWRTMQLGAEKRLLGYKKGRYDRNFTNNLAPPQRGRGRMSNSSNPKASCFVKAANRREAVMKMIDPDPILRALYDEGPNKDGKGGWINLIKDQHAQAYRLLFYLDRIPLSRAYDNQEPYAVLYGEIDPKSDKLNFPRALYTTTGAVNLMRDGIPGPKFVKMLLRGHFEIEPFKEERDILVKHLTERGCLYACVYDKEAEGLRILDLQEYSEIYFVPRRNEIQVRNEEEIVLGDMSELRPFVLKLAPKREVKTSELDLAAKEADIIWKDITKDS